MSSEKSLTAYVAQFITETKPSRIPADTGKALGKDSGRFIA